MAYYLDLFSPETYEAFTHSSQDISGFRIRHEGLAGRVKIGDKLICYMTKLGRWCGILEVTSEYFKDETPIFYPTDDPFIVRFRVKPNAWLSKVNAIPIKDDRVWSALSFTKGVTDGSPRWTGKLRNSLNILDEKDGAFLEEFILSQKNGGETFAIDEEEYQKHLSLKVKRIDKDVTVSVPEDNKQEAKKARVRYVNP